MRALTSLARLHLDAGQSGLALAVAHEALRELEDVLGYLGEEEGAFARSAHEDLFAVGALAAVRLGSPGEVLEFLERGRAGALLDSLDKREVLRWKERSLPADLLRDDLGAQAAVQEARRAYDRAQGTGDRGEIRARAAGLDDANDRLREVASRMQRETKQQAEYFYPRAKPMEDVEAALSDGQALVLYGLARDRAFALVLRPDGESIVDLGERQPVEAACAELDASAPGDDPGPALDRLRSLLVAPLGLPSEVESVLVSPEGALCYLPYGALFDRAVALSPSGTAHALLLGEERGKGEGVLALGDPDYGGVSEGARAVYFRSRPLAPLPATRSEAEAVGTTTLLGLGPARRDCAPPCRRSAVARRPLRLPRARRRRPADAVRRWRSRRRTRTTTGS